MALLVEITLMGVLPIGFALWQIRDVRREQRRRTAARLEASRLEASRLEASRDETSPLQPLQRESSSSD